MKTPLSARASALALSLALAACGGGGGSTVTPPTPTPSPSPSATVVPGVKLSVFSFNSYPAGIPVTIRLQGATAPTALGPAPQATQPAVAHVPYTVTWNGASPYSVVIDQSQNGDHQLLYNQFSDTLGQINTNTISSTTRAVASANFHPTRATETGHPVMRLRGRPTLSTTRLFVRYAADYARTSRRDLIANEERSGLSGVSDIGELGNVSVREVTVPENQSIEQVSAALRRLKGVVSVERVHIRYASTVAPAPANNPHYLPDEQWDMFQIGAAYAWGYTKGDSITIAIVDTGIDTNNPQLNQKLTFQEQVIAGVRTVGPLATQDTNGHGTNVAGIAAALVNDGIGFAGVGYNVKLQAYKVFPNDSPTGPGDPPGADTGDEALAIKDAVANGADVINLSLGAQQDTLNSDGSSGKDIVENDAIQYAISQGVVVVAAAGNEGASGVANLDYPANDDNVISVGATSLHDNNTGIPSSSNQEYVASYSNAAPNLSVVAPGGDPVGNDVDYLHWIYNITTTTATNPVNQCKYKTDCKSLFAGTSQATPHVSGTIALVLAAAGGRHSMSVAQITQLIQSTADNINDPKQGHGRINAYRAVAAAAHDVQPPAYIPNATQFVAFAYTNSGSSVPVILDLNYPKGVPVDGNGAFRIADVPPSIGNFKIGVWYDSNGDGVIDAGDLFGSVQTTCSSQANVCGTPRINVARVGSNFTLP